MSLQLLAQIAQIASPLVAAIAAVFAARSSAASSRAARAAERGQEHAADELARQRRPDLRLELDQEEMAGLLTYSIRAVNWDRENVAQDVRAELGSAGSLRTVLVKDRIGADQSQRGRSGMHQPTIADEDVDFESPERETILLARLRFSDELGLARWMQEYVVLEQAERFADGIRRTLLIEPRSVPYRMRNLDEVAGPSLRRRALLAWRVLRGTSSVED